MNSFTRTTGAPPLIMLIRHAEKPQDGARPQGGVDASGRSDENALSVRGWQRAGALVRLFDPLDEATARPRLGRPTALFASRANDANPSTRPRDTLLPLAEALALPIDERFDEDAPVSQVARTLLEFDAPVLVSWRHDKPAGIGQGAAQGRRCGAAALA